MYRGTKYCTRSLIVNFVENIAIFNFPCSFTMILHWGINQLFQSTWIPAREGFSWGWLVGFVLVSNLMNSYQTCIKISL